MALKLSELRGLIGKKIQIDEYQAKMGEDKDVVTVSIEVSYYNPALDLVNFLEKGYDWVLDADISSGEMSDGGYLVFIEAERKPSFPKNFLKMLSDLEGVSENKLEDYKFLYFKGHEYQPLNIENLENVIPLTPSEYVATHGESEDENNVEVETEPQTTDNEKFDNMMESMRNSAGIPHKKKEIKDTELKNFINLSKR